jgi:hypothetical protein
MSSLQPAICGWDVGGAHVKVSRVDAAGVVTDIAQWACPLWQGLEHLHRAIDAAAARWPGASHAHSRHAITMTGEMVDLFADREQGVRAIVEALAGRLGAGTVFFAGAAGWLDAARSVAQWWAVASANWLVTAQYVATRMPDCLLVDIGSTTTDIVPIARGSVAARGTSDATRLVTGELAYHGVVRTPLCGIAHRSIGASFEQVCAAHPSLAGAPVVGAGCGRFLAAALARSHARDYVDFGTFARTPSDAPHDAAEWIATCAPGVAVALLMAGGDGQRQASTRAARAQTAQQRTGTGAGATARRRSRTRAR